MLLLIQISSFIIYLGIGDPAYFYVTSVFLLNGLVGSLMFLYGSILRYFSLCFTVKICFQLANRLKEP